jgi:hypothetical protein
MVMNLQLPVQSVPVTTKVVSSNLGRVKPMTYKIDSWCFSDKHAALMS